MKMIQVGKTGQAGRQGHKNLTVREKAVATQSTCNTDEQKQ